MVKHALTSTLGTLAENAVHEGPAVIAESGTAIGLCLETMRQV